MPNRRLMKKLAALRRNWWQSWWQRQTPARQDQLATMAPVVSVALFLTAIFAAIAYFTVEEIDREQAAVRRDVVYAQQQLQLHLQEQQEQLARIARGIANGDLNAPAFVFQSELLVSEYPELRSVAWVNGMREVVSSYALPSAASLTALLHARTLDPAHPDDPFARVRESLAPQFVTPSSATDDDLSVMLMVPIPVKGSFQGMLIATYSLEGILRFGTPGEILSRYAVGLVNREGRLLAGSTRAMRATGLRRLPWAPKPQVHEVPVPPLDRNILMRAQAHRSGGDPMGDAFFWVVGAMSLLTIWLLLGTSRHARRRLQAQRALRDETHFRRAMENSMLTGMRALDMQGRITYVNPAFCRLTGWNESDLLGSTAPFPYWPEHEHDNLRARLEDEISGRSTPGGFEVPVKRKDGTIFYARMYVSPLVDASGKQTGWMTSMTDISEPKRIREELTASYDRFTTVLDSLDVAISVAPLNSAELLFANRMYQTCFGAGGRGHRLLVDLSSELPSTTSSENGDLVDVLAGLPTNTLLEASAENAEIYVPELQQWMEVRTRYLTWVDGRLAQMVIATDITTRHLAEQQAALQAERAETASRLITMGEMASSVAHELNQPLTAISNYSSGMISRLKKQQITEDELLGALEKTAKQAQRAGQIIQRIRAFVKRSEPNPTLSDVAQMVSNATELAEIELRRQMIRLNIYVAARLPKLMVDPILVEQVLINLIKNGGESIVHAQRPPPQRHIELTVAPRQIDGIDTVEFTVRDSGNGIPPEKLERIYEAFYSTKSEGMGIGLKLCRSIVESHHGRLQARNLYNGAEVTGCEFSFWIPLASNVNK